MDDLVTHPDDLGRGNAGVSLPKSGRDATGGFADDLDQVSEGKPQVLIRTKATRLVRSIFSTAFRAVTGM
jgi:hypothetical protein